MKHHTKLAFVRDIDRIMSERGLNAGVDGQGEDSLGSLLKFVDKHKYEYGFSYPTFDAASSREDLHYRIVVYNVSCE